VDFSLSLTGRFGLRHWAPDPIERLCPICQHQGYFQGFGWPVRPEAQCPSCGSLERHRLFALWTAKHPEAIAGKRILHFAPEGAVRQLVEPMAAHYVTADLQPGLADLKVDLEQMTSVADGSFDVLICFHVLEHVANDRRALCEMFRVLADRGVALIMTPVVEGWEKTYEGPSITDPQMRWVHFEQDDHVRIYGADFRQRVRDAGFKLEEFTAVEPFVWQHGLIRADKLFIAVKS
jgi:SAM-dependent methyltransferase